MLPTLLQYFWLSGNSSVGSFLPISFVLCSRPPVLLFGLKFFDPWQSNSNNFHVQYRFQSEGPKNKTQCMNTLIDE